jgi:hypothetical protein
MASRAAKLKLASQANTPFSEDELDMAVNTLRSVVSPSEFKLIDWDKYRALVAKYAHESPKLSWSHTAEAASSMMSIIGSPDSPVFRTMFARVLQDGNWEVSVICV